MDSSRFESACGTYPRLSRALHELREQFEAGRAFVEGPEPGAPSLEDVGVGGRDASRYRFLRELGRGGMGIVHEVWDPELRRVLALKRMRSRGELAGTGAQLARERARLRFLEEAQVLGQLQHPGIVPVLEIGVQGDELYFTMPRIEGEDFGHIVRRVHDPDDAWSLPRAVATLQRACEAVAHAHRRGVLHRDLKPSNVLVGDDGETYVVDWGLARVGAGEPAALEPLGPEGESSSGSGVSSDRSDLARSSPDSPLVSAAGDVVGTPAYMPPEQAEGRTELLDERADVYGLGAMLYELLAGAAPYAEGDEPQDRRALLGRVRSGPPARLERRAPYAPDELVAICERAMHRDREHRYRDAHELAGELRAHLEGRVVRAHRTGAWAELTKWMGRHRAIVALLLTLVALLAGSAVGFGLLYRRAEDQRRTAAAARADSLRRQSALRGMAPVGRSLPSFRDGFDDGWLDRRWIATKHAELVEERDGHLVLTAGVANEETAVRLDPYVSVLRGDFDVSLDYRLVDFDVPAVERGTRTASLMVYDAVEDRMEISIERSAEREPAVCEGVERSVQVLRGGSDERICLPEASPDGRMRLTREGETYRAFHWVEGRGLDGWVEIASHRGTRGPALLRLIAVNWYTEEAFRFEIDTLHVRTDPRPSIVPLAPWIDDFSDGRIDPRLVLYGDAGIVAELDGRLHLEKIGGRTGSVGLRSDATRWSLSGDGAIEVAYRLENFEPPERGSVYLALRVGGVGGGSFGAVEVKQRASGRFIKAFYHVERAEVPSEADEGRLRVRREGTDLLFEHWDGAWQTILVRPHVGRNAKLDFRIDLTAPDSEQEYVATLDELSVDFGGAR